MPEDDSTQKPLEIRLLRVDDFVDLRATLYGCVIDDSTQPSTVVAGADAVLALAFPPQHIAETVYDQPPAGDPLPIRPTARHCAAGPSRLIFAIDELTFDLSVEGILGATTGRILRVTANAIPLPPLTQAVPAPIPAAPPGHNETAIEAPYRMIVSPSARETFVHSASPVGAASSPEAFTELWRTHLAVRPAGDEPVDPSQSIVRVVWTPDTETDPNENGPLGPSSLKPSDRVALMKQTATAPGSARTPLQVSDLALSSLGAWMDWAGAFDETATITDYRHIATMGRDSYVRVSYPGFLFPFGHKCVYVEVSERRIEDRQNPVARLIKRRFIVIRESTRTYSAADNPFSSVTITPAVTPDLDPQPDGTLFVPQRGHVPYQFTLTVTDRAGDTHVLAAPLVFVRLATDDATGSVRVVTTENVPYFYSSTLINGRHVNVIDGTGRHVAMASPEKPGDSVFEVSTLTFAGDIESAKIIVPGPIGRASRVLLKTIAIWSEPRLAQASLVVPAMRQLTPSSPTVDVAYAEVYTGGGANPAGMLLTLINSVGVNFSSGSDRSGGLISPNMRIGGISRSLGVVGDDGTGPLTTSGTFDPTAFFEGALPKLFGLFALTDVLDVAELGTAPSFLSAGLDTKSVVLDTAQRLNDAVSNGVERLGNEVTNAAHQGAENVAQQMMSDLSTRESELRNAVGSLLDTITGLPGSQPELAGRADALNAQLGQLAATLTGSGLPVAVRTQIEQPLATLQSALAKVSQIAGTLSEIEQFAKGMLDPGGTSTSRLAFHPKMLAWPQSGAVAHIFAPRSPVDAFTLAVEVTRSPGVVSTEILAEISNFDLNLVGDRDAALMKLSFQRIGFRCGSSGKPEVDVVFGELQFCGVLGFVDTLRSLIPFDGFSDPPSVSIGPDGATAGFDLALPNVGVGVFSLENISLGADARIPFLGDAVTMGFHFCAKESPFRLTVICIGGGGWVALRASPKGMVALEMGLEAAASLSVDLGVASGSVSVSIGVYLRLEDDGGSLTGYFRIRGEVNVLGLVSACITLELALDYEFKTGKLVGRASLAVEVDVLCFSASVEITCERKLAGSSGDPTMREIMPPDPVSHTNGDWTQYCNAFAAVPA